MSRNLTRRADAIAYETKDGSIIRELMHPAAHASRAQSLAEATVLPGQRTALHRHACSEELYHIIEGEGRMTLGAEEFDVAPGDTICIRPGTAHCIVNNSAYELRLLCCCSPPYAHDDTELL